MFFYLPAYGYSVILLTEYRPYLCKNKWGDRKVKKSNSKIVAAKVITTIKEAKAKKNTTENIITSNKKEISTLNRSNNPALIQTEPVFRYSDEELNIFRELIAERLDVAKQELQFLQGQMTGKDVSGLESSSDLRLSLEDGSGAMDREQLSHLTSRQGQYISNLEKAA